MNVVIISPEGDDARELSVLPELFSAGLVRYHVRKPGWSVSKLETWIGEIAAADHSKLILHQHHALVDTYGLGGRHWRDGESAPDVPRSRPGFASRSCHDPRHLASALGAYDAVLFSPLFASLSKPGYGPGATLVSDVKTVLRHRTPAQRRTAVFALGGVTPERISLCHELGFDGVACLGYVWQAPDPVAAFQELQSSLVAHAG